MNFVRTLRNELKLNQQKFADLVGCSYASIQNYEGGKRVPRNVFERLTEIAHEHGFEFATDEDRPDAKAATPPPAKQHTSDKHQRWHDMLEAVLESENQAAIEAVQSNLIVFSDYIRGLPIKLQPARKKSS